MPIIQAKPLPVISVVGTDIIYYGSNLTDYLEYEFILKSDYSFEKKITDETYIPFWTDVIMS